MTTFSLRAGRTGESGSLWSRLAGPAPSRPRCSRGLALAVAVLGGLVVAPASIVAQERGYYVRVAPGYSWTTVEHTRNVAIGEIFGNSASSGNAGELSVHFSAGFRGQRALQWFLGFEVEGIIYAPRTIAGAIRPTSPLFPWDPDPGMWEYTSKTGLGFNIVLERAVTRSQRVLAFVGVHRMRTEVVSGVSERTGVFQENSETRTRLPFTGGVGAAWGPLNLRASYFRSLIPWDLLSPEFEVRYGWRASGVSVNLGVEAF